MAASSPESVCCEAGISVADAAPDANAAGVGVDPGAGDATPVAQPATMTKNAAASFDIDGETRARDVS